MVEGGQIDLCVVCLLTLLHILHLLMIFRYSSLHLTVLNKNTYFNVFPSLLNGVWSMVHMDVVFLTDLTPSLKVKWWYYKCFCTTGKRSVLAILAHVEIGKSLEGSSTIKAPLYHHLCLKEGRVAGGRKGQRKNHSLSQLLLLLSFQQFECKTSTAVTPEQNSAVLMQLCLKQTEVQSTVLSLVVFQRD